MANPCGDAPDQPMPVYLPLIYTHDVIKAGARVFANCAIILSLSDTI